jgi:uncharacterized protein YgbK (DUF1537 family)
MLTLCKTVPALLIELGEATPGSSPERVVRNAGELTAYLLSKADIDLLVIFGGDTLYGVITALPGASLHPLAELAPGVVASELCFSDRRVTLVSKAGGLGEEDFLPNVLARYGISF